MTSKSSNRRRCVFGCSTIDVSIHSFPNPKKFPDQYERWIQVAGEPLKHLSADDIYRKKRICDIHFTEKDWNRNNRLNALAVPSLFIPGQVDSYNMKIYEDEENGSGSNELQYLLHDHTYSLPVGVICVEIKGESAKDNKTDLNLRVEDTTVAINDQCNDTDDNAKDYDVDNNDDDDDDVVVPNTPALEAERLPQELFSWEKTNVIVADSTEVKLDERVEASEMNVDLGDVSMYNDEQPTNYDNDTDPYGEYSEYRCNECGNEIKGFRYTCVQCADWDLCAACEARAAHATHYVLRVPGQRPYKEMQTVLAAIRHQMLSEDLFLPEIIASIKEELKDEDAEVPDGVPEPEGDPLGAWNVSQHDDDDDYDTHEIFPERRDEDGHSPRKRPKTSLDYLANTQTLTPCDDSSYSNLATMTDDVLIQSDKDGTRNDDDPNRNSKFDYSDPIQVIDIDKLIKTHEQTEHTKQNDNDTTQTTKEISTGTSQHRCVSLREDILGTSKPHNKREKLVDLSNAKPPLKILNLTSHTQDDTQSVRIGTHRQEIGTDGKGIETRYAGTHRYRLKIRRTLTTGTEIHNKGIGSHSIANTDGEIKKRYKILLPPGAHWKQFLVTMLKSRVTVQLEDVMRKRKCKED